MMYEEIIHSMTLEDKIALCSGKDFWHTKDFEKYIIFLLKLRVKRLKAQ